MSVKHIYDVSPCIYTGHYSQFRKSPDFVYGLPVGGIYFLLRRITSELLVGNKIALAFDYSHGAPTKKLEGYKSNRSKDVNVVIQSDFLYDILRECNIPCYRGFGEADDHVFGLAQAGTVDFIPNYDKVIIHSSDYDLAHNVDERGVSLRAVNSNTNNVDYSNFSSVLGMFEKYNGDIYFNTISAFKTCFYDRSDSINSPKLASVKGKDVYEGFVKFLIDNNVHSAQLTSNKELFVSFIKSFVNNENDLKTLITRADAIFPKDLSDRVGGYEFGDKTTVNMNLLAVYCYSLRDKVSLSSMGRNGFRVYSEDSLIPKVEDKIKSYGKDFKTGIYAADNNLSVSSCFVFGDKVNVRRDF